MVTLIEIGVAASAAGLLIGVGIGRLTLRGRLRDAEAELHERLTAAQLEDQLSMKFENLANRIFDEKSDRLKKESHESLGHLLGPLRERLQEFQKRIEDNFTAHRDEQISLKKEIEHIAAVHKDMSVQTESLTRALKGDVKTQGNWGEMILEKILESSGLRKDVEYITQGAGLGLRGAEGGLLKPDVIVMLPENRHIIIDAKVSLTAYERYAATQEPQALKEHLVSVRAQVNRLAETRYQDNEKLGTPDFVLMFMPIEGAYALALQEDQSLHAYAWERKIVIVSPATLFATLKTVESVWRLERQNKHAQDIAKRGGLLYDKVVGFVEEMQDLGRKLSATQKAYDESLKKLSTGTGNVIRQAEELKSLGVKAAKALPKELMDSDAA